MTDYTQNRAEVVRLRDTATTSKHWDTTGDLVASARAKLLAALNSASMVGDLVGKDPTGGAWTDGWVFNGFDSTGKPFRDVEGTGKAAVVLHARNEWGSNQNNTMQMPVLVVLVFADSSRAANGTIILRDAELRAKAVTKVVVNTFHDAANADHDWPGGVYVISSVRADGSYYDDVPDKDGVIRATTRFEVATR